MYVIYRAVTPPNLHTDTWRVSDQPLKEQSDILGTFVKPAEFSILTAHLQFKIKMVANLPSKFMIFLIFFKPLVLDFRHQTVLQTLA